MGLKEPQIHSGIEDGLKEDHIKANESLYCEKCDAMIHAFNNECMTTWVESGKGSYCISCFVEEYNKRDNDEEWGLKIV